MGTQPADTWRSPKGLLALISLLLCGLLWLNGLAGSLARPSVGDALELRQLELAALAEPALPEPWRAPLLGSDPLGQLRQQLAAAGAAAETPLPDSQLTTWGLLEQLLGRPQQARQILAGLPNGVLPPGQQLSPLQQRLQCELTGRSRSQCSQPVVAGAALRRLLLVTLAPAVLMLLGVLLLLRQLWLWRQGRLVPVAPLQGPQLSLIEVALVVAGGFVVLGELVAPLLLGPLLSRALAPLAADPPLQQALSVLLLYATLMLGPLLILIAFLRQRGPAPRGGWLQWNWLPLRHTIPWAVAQLLMVLPLVALTGWVLQHLWPNPSGSNPLLDMVLTNANPLALALLASTALVLAPLFEETLFRGVLLPVLARHWGQGSAVLASAAFFALAHLSLGELAPLFVLGLGLGWLRLQSGRLGASALLHSLWNGITFANLLLLAG
jgi:membrane protease YdiL (CAAX protease family)